MTYDCKIQGLQTVMHMSMSKVHLLKKEGNIIWPGNPIDGKKIAVEVKTPKTKHGFGKATAAFYIVEADSPTFATVDEFLTHYSQLTIQ